MTPESQDFKPLLYKPDIPNSIFIGVAFFSMLPAVKFNDDSFFKIHKINNVRTQWLLPAEFIPFHLAIA